jgi:hypothetical protein
MNYELFMGEALAEARHSTRGRAPERRGRASSTRRWSPGPTIASRTNDPTAHAVIVAPARGGPEARPRRARRRDDLHDQSSRARCASGRCSRATSRRSSIACRNPTEGAAGASIQLAQHPSLPRRIKIVQRHPRDEAEALFLPLAAG